ncbi:MAG: Uncharacterized protein CEN88_37 [Candidatus Berkelbacteria bacterium Licking1014_2]|uniref:Uncharacterized protein n=1 Tax=Candidatus Berkelbacteria bacterium Licking1014_2 TaxID=2017146 RepID=A0A554LX59_9BACT|nr:MAG: Uncharacterized protein CEN88_37 [Candidatus Berkelbacteria bacterium Licking1014_2]
MNIMINYTFNQLPNGLKIISAPLENSQVGTMMILVGVGSRDEIDRQAGISHFLEHLLFKGTKSRPSTLSISRELDKLGAQYNAFTSLEYTGYWFSAAAGQFPAAFAVLTDMFFNSLLVEEEVEREKGTILEEINMRNDVPQDRVEQTLHQLMYPDQPFGRDIIGSKKTVSAITRKNLLDYYRQRYQPAQTMIIIAGDNQKMAQWQRLTEDAFANWRPLTHPFSRQPVAVEQRQPRQEWEKKSVDQGHLRIGFRAVNAISPQAPVLEILANALGGMMSSPLFLEVRERRGWAYSVKAEAGTVSDTGWLEIKAGLTLEHLEEAAELIWRLCREMAEKPLSPDDLEKARDNWLGHFYLDLQTAEDIARFLADEAYYFSRPRQPEEIEKQIRAVTGRDIQNLAQKIFQPENFNLALISPIRPISLLDKFD